MRIRDTAHESCEKSKDTAAPVSVRVEFFDNLIGYFKKTASLFESIKFIHC